MSGKPKIPVRVERGLRPIFEEYLENLGRTVQILIAALDREPVDYTVLITAGHRIKGAAASYGLAAAGQLGGLIEQAARAGQAEELKRLVWELAAYLARLAPEYEA